MKHEPKETGPRSLLCTLTVKCLVSGVCFCAPATPQKNEKQRNIDSSYRRMSVLARCCRMSRTANVARFFQFSFSARLVSLFNEICDRQGGTMAAARRSTLVRPATPTVQSSNRFWCRGHWRRCNVASAAPPRHCGCCTRAAGTRVAAVAAGPDRRRAACATWSRCRGRWRANPRRRRARPRAL